MDDTQACHAPFYAICVVTFDLELGQVLENVYSTAFALSPMEQSNLCYMSFPDSNSGCMGDTKFVVRVRCGPTRKNHCKRCRNKLDFMWGYVYFRQVKDATLPRGYFQKSVVILTDVYNIEVLAEMSVLIADDVFSGQTRAIRRAYERVLARHRRVFQAGSINDLFCRDVCDDFRTMPSLITLAAQLQILWEIVLFAEPIVVFASNPTMCSNMILSLIRLIEPLVYHGDFRPYFTIHDSEFKEFTSDGPDVPSVALGVTNPFFSKTFQHWPHQIRIRDKNEPKPRPTTTKQWFEMKTRHKANLQINKSLLRTATTSRDDAHVTDNDRVKHYFRELTESFVYPLERYMRTLLPLQRDIGPFKLVNAPLPFNVDNFLSSLPLYGPQLTSKIQGNWEGLYRRFFQTSNFSRWYAAKHREMTQRVQILQLQTLLDVDFTNVLRDSSDVEIVNVFASIARALKTNRVDRQLRDRIHALVRDHITLIPLHLQMYFTDTFT